MERIGNLLRWAPACALIALSGCAAAAEKEGHGCAGVPDTCEGIDVNRLSLEALRR
jgi:hypothetical protein